jgi:hypothetical protein
MLVRIRYTSVMLMVILGAGASFDSAQAYRPGSQMVDEPWRPPLAKDLFLDTYETRGDIVEKYPKLTHVLPRLREPENGRSVEQMLEGLQERGANDVEIQRELASVRFYLSELLHKVTEKWTAKTNGVTNYAPLIGDILRFSKPGEQVCLVTFNYDSLLERALYTFDFKSTDPEHFLDSHPTLKLFNLHGSVDWARLVDLPDGTRLQPQRLIQEVNKYRVSDKFVRANATDPSQMFSFERPIFPAIAIPVQTKSEDHFECPRGHLGHLAEMLKHVSKILIIGWQAKEAHFLGMLRMHGVRPNRVMVVGENESDAKLVRRTFLHGIGVELPDEVVGQRGFTHFIIHQEGNGFLVA